MNGLEKKSRDDLLRELESLEEQYVKNLASRFDKNELNKIWERIKALKDELAKREEGNHPH